MIHYLQIVYKEQQLLSECHLLNTWLKKNNINPQNGFNRIITTEDKVVIPIEDGQFGYALSDFTFTIQYPIGQTGTRFKCLLSNLTSIEWIGKKPENPNKQNLIEEVRNKINTIDNWFDYFKKKIK